MSHSAASLDTTVAAIAAKIAQGLRIGREEARWLWENASDAELCSLAAGVRGRFHKPGTCTYMVMRIINYTNVCVAQCDYCAFYKLPGQDGGYVLSHDEVFNVQNMKDFGNQAAIDRHVILPQICNRLDSRSAFAFELLLRIVCSDTGAVWGRS